MVEVLMFRANLNVSTVYDGVSVGLG